AGTSAVGKKFKNKVEKVISNDKEFYSFVLAKNYIENTVKIKRSKELIKELNNIAKINPIKGKIYKHYSLGGGENRQYFSDFNAMKIDSMRIKISEWKYDNFINEKECYFLLASLLESADKVANTASVYGAFLKHLKPSAQKELILLPAEFECTHTKHLVFNENANDLIKKIKGDILYLDPPYNSREYGANYHVLNSIAMYDDFIPQGKTGLRAYEKSAWCKKNLVFDALEDLIKNADFKFIFLSYNDEGLLSLEQIRQIFEKYGKYDFKSQIYQRFKADSKRICQQNKTIEYLHILEKF
ncbi:TPA: DNA adenine methylase, partial [Campylobacter jejuni]|nr:modification methylase [Campylobacter jejuni]EAI9929956.1 modification methylase [Campylobacter jejuni]EAJ9422541.1 modification methylase [Campylobacter jejuni]EAK5647655.1 modification methylase [Campylobacter jejuni]EAK5919023.1 modification methylase [Campylobacter jejuni]